VISRVGVPFGEFAVVGVTHTLRAKTINGRSAISCSIRYARNTVAQSETMGNRKMSTNDDRGAMARNDILQRAKRGEISPQHAEWEAMDAGCWPLAVQFPSGFDPLGERHWTLFMAAAWIVTRNPNDVRAVWNHYRTKRTKWVESPLAGEDGAILEGKKSWTIEPLSPLTGGEADKLVSGLARLDAICQPDAAWSELQHALRAGDIVARGTPPETGIQQNISPDDWSGIYWLEDDRSQPDHCVFDNSDRLRYRDVSVESKAIIQNWPSRDELDAQAFGRPIWTTEMVLHRIENRSHVGFQSWATLRPHPSTSPTTARRDAPPERALEDELSAGKVVGYRGGQAEPREYWFGKSVAGEKGVSFERSAICKAWPPRKVEPRLALTKAEAESAIRAKENELAKPLNQGKAVELLMESFPGRVTRDDARRLVETLVEPAKRGRKKQEI
jgi:hypothetical protein